LLNLLGKVSIYLGWKKFGMKIRNWGKYTLTTELSKPTRQSTVMILSYCQCAVIANGADHGGGKPELYLGSKKKF
jgi:hypothetical protein